MHGKRETELPISITNETSDDTYTYELRPEYEYTITISVTNKEFESTNTTINFISPSGGMFQF